MKPRIVFVAAIAVAALALTAQAREKKVKAAAVPRLTVFSQSVYGVEPNIEAILNFTDEQKEKFRSAFAETINAPALADLRPKKGEPADPAKLARLKEEMPKARAELQKRVEDILTPEQKATIAKVNESVSHALDGVLTPEQKEKLEALKKKKKSK